MASLSHDLRGGGLRGGSHRLRDRDGDVDPMANVANIVDAMLVLSVGLMVAIVSYWNVDISHVQEVAKQNEMTEVNDIEKIVDNSKSSGSGYTELGKVYQDPKTGKMYMLTQDADKGASAKGNPASKD